MSRIYTNFERPYGQELILDLEKCKSSLFNRKSINFYFEELCKLIEMKKCAVHFWDDVGVKESEKQTDPDKKGTSAVCFILTSSIVLHTLDIRKEVYLNIFSCKEFDYVKAARFTQEFFCGIITNHEDIYRGVRRINEKEENERKRDEKESSNL